MCGIGGGGGYDAPDVPAPPPVQPEAPDASRQQTVAKDPDAERRRRMAAGQSGTILTGPRGVLSDDNIGQQKTLLGA